MTRFLDYKLSSVEVSLISVALNAERSRLEEKVAELRAAEKFDCDATEEAESRLRVVIGLDYKLTVPWWEPWEGFDERTLENDLSDEEIKRLLY